MTTNMEPTFIEWRSCLGMFSRFVIDGHAYFIKWDPRGYQAWYYNHQLYIAESNSTLRGNFRDTAAYVLHTDFSNCYPKFPKAYLEDLLKTEKTLICFSKAKDDPWSWTLNDGRIARISNSFWYTEWHIDNTLVMRAHLPYRNPLKTLLGIYEIDLYIDNEKMFPVLLGLFVLSGQNISSG